MGSNLVRSRLQTLLLASIAFLTAITLVMYPEQAFTSSLKGLKIWWDVVFPALLPFFITAEVMMGFGVVHFFGILLEPLMRPIFRVPGTGAFVMAVGFISGNPMGAKLTARLREQKLITREEGERLIAFTSTASPLFIFGAIAVGFFEDASLGFVLAIAHYTSSILVGIIMRFYQKDALQTPTHKGNDSSFLLLRAFKSMHRARLEDGRPLGQLLGEAVTSAVQTLLLIGGFIILFSVLIHLIDHIGIYSIFSYLFAHLFEWLSFSPSLSEPFIAGILEITLGSQMISSTTIQIPLVFKLAVISFLIGWNGLSIHAQIASIISRTDLRYTPYLIAKILHGCLASLFIVLIWKFFTFGNPKLQMVIPVSNQSLTDTSILLWNQWQHICTGIVLIWFFFIFYQFSKSITR